jgi:L-amino acid N-acyltransferase YncA
LTTFLPMTPHITSNPDHVTIMVLNERKSRSLGTASANVHPLKGPNEKCWWISRVLVTSDEDRGKGWGGMMLDTLIVEITKQGGLAIIVTPGGYNADPKKQKRFYEQHDFVKTGKEPTAHWLWTRSEETARNLAVRAAGYLLRRSEEADAAQDQAV